MHLLTEEDEKDMKRWWLVLWVLLVGCCLGTVQQTHVENPTTQTTGSKNCDHAWGAWIDNPLERDCEQGGRQSRPAHSHVCQLCGKEETEEVAGDWSACY